MTQLKPQTGFSPFLEKSRNFNQIANGSASLVNDQGERVNKHSWLHLDETPRRSQLIFISFMPLKCHWHEPPVLQHVGKSSRVWTTFALIKFKASQICKNM